MRNAFMDIMTHAKFHFNWLMLTLIFGIRASEPPLPPGPGKQLKRPGLIGLKCEVLVIHLRDNFETILNKCRKNLLIVVINIMEGLKTAHSICLETQIDKYSNK